MFFNISGNKHVWIFILLLALQELKHIPQMAFQLLARFEFEIEGKQLIYIRFVLKPNNYAYKRQSANPNDESTIESKGSQKLAEKQHRICPEVIGWHNYEEFWSFLIVERIFHIIGPIQPPRQPK